MAHQKRNCPRRITEKNMSIRVELWKMLRENETTLGNREQSRWSSEARGYERARYT